MRSHVPRTPYGRMLAIVSALAAALALLLAPAAADETGAASEVRAADDHEVTPARVDGRNRFETAEAVATTTFEEADVGIVVTADDYPDALAASYAAGAGPGYPILLVHDDGVPVETFRALHALDVHTVHIVGGPGAVPEAIRHELEHEGFAVHRIAGGDRFETAAQVAQQVQPDDGIGTLDGDTTALLASGEDFPDALAAGPLSARASFPLLLTPANAPHPAVDHALDALGIERVVVIGGSGAVGPVIVQHYQQQGYAVERFDGRNRTETAVTVAQNAIERIDGFTAEGILLARGDDYPDALTASIHGGVIGAPLVLTATPTVLSPATEGWLLDTCPAIEFVRAIGGVGAVSDQALSEAVHAAGQCRNGDADPGSSFCSNVDGFTVSYTDRWVTNIERIDEVPACSLFDPDPESFEFEGQEIPLSIGAYLRITAAVEFDDAATADPQVEREVDREVTTVDERTAVRLETEATGDGQLPEGALSTRWVVDLGDGSVFLASSHEVGEPAYAEKVTVLDDMMGAITFDA
jgi:putative cell wall-binding protein